MKYHAKLIYGNEVSFWTNWDKEGLVEKLIIPYFNGQIITRQRKGGRVLLNLKSASELKIYRTKTGSINGVKINSAIMKQARFEEYHCTEEVIKEMKLNLAAPNSQSLLQQAFAPLEEQVFVIMKFGDKILDSAYEGVIKPLFTEFGLTVIRVDEIQDSGKISDQILQEIAKSKIVYSDLSGERPNCYYETGFAHALGKEIILSINTKDKIHFDLSGHRFIQWETENDLRKSLRKRVSFILEQE